MLEIDNWFEDWMQSQRDSLISWSQRVTFCEQCGKRFNDWKGNKDPGICSLECGYAYRGLSSRDFY